MIWDFTVRKRTNVLWAGQDIPAEAALLLTRLRFSVLQPKDVSELNKDSFIDGLAAVVFVQTEANPKAVIQLLKQHAVNLLDRDCLVVVLAANKIQSTGNQNLAIITNALMALKVPSYWPTLDRYEGFDGKNRDTRNIHGVPKPPYVAVYRESVSVDVITDLLIRHNQRPTPALDNPTEFKITGPGASELKPKHQLMFRRSFFDCSEVHLSSLRGGFSGVKVFIAHATLKKANRPLPLFVKVGARSEILREWENYDEHVRPFVPFHLAPHLLPERCALGAHTGIIVGDFIEDSESLGECARRGRAITAVGALFDRTLRGWHRKPEIRHGTLCDALHKKLADKTVNFLPRLERAKKLGAKNTLQELLDKLKNRPKEMQLWSRIHGDLHADNVCVRGGDAILIDFVAGKEGLLLADHAALEVSIAVRVPQENGGLPFDREAWERVVRPLYKKECLRSLPSFPDSKESYSWIADCVRQIRLHALPMEQRPGQYEQVVIYLLLQAATKDLNAKPDEDFRRTMAYCLADNLVEELTNN